ncbi:hypothetical protein [Flavobacterium kingsejongi]|uniref:hypothetical protein n=1 Tax=Flavobacterium kingsejongi TaxID=1678728 RepID=UPI000D52C3D6|nr:hypothetical protein [Flavobacterium kingsejongi]
MANVTFGQPRFSPPEATKDKLIYDLVMFVPGTTDPLNTSALKHEANKEYWRANMQNLRARVKELKFQYNNLHIEDEFFSWSGDNNTQERNAAAERLLDLFLRNYSGWKRKEVHLHLIGHSHGGNVINEFTDLITRDNRFPEFWKIKSITYLSTPFFQKKHQLNHAKLHKNCKIINVHNEYDITQRFVADFTLINLEILITNFQKGDFDKALARLKEPDFKVYDMLNRKLGGLNLAEGRNMWRQTAILLDGVSLLLSAILKYINSIKTDKFKTEKKQFTGLLGRLQKWANDARTTFISHQNSRPGNYSRGAFFDDINLLHILRLLNEFLAIRTNENDSYLLGVLEVFFRENTGITDSIEETAWNPKKQTKGLEIVDVNITPDEIYDARNKKKNFDGFINGIQAAQRNNKLREILMRLLSQFVTGAQIQAIRDKISTLEYVVWGAEDDELVLLRETNLRVYQGLVTRYNADLIARYDKELPLADRPGGIPYLATVSHSLSHTQFWEKAEIGLRSAFSSGVNKGYNKK